METPMAPGAASQGRVPDGLPAWPLPSPAALPAAGLGMRDPGSSGDSWGALGPSAPTDPLELGRFHLRVQQGERVTPIGRAVGDVGGSCEGGAGRVGVLSGGVTPGQWQWSPKLQAVLYPPSPESPAPPQSGASGAQWALRGLLWAGAVQRFGSPSEPRRERRRRLTSFLGPGAPGRKRVGWLLPPNCSF